MNRRQALLLALGLGVTGWVGGRWLLRREEFLAIDPAGETYAYHDGWIVRR